MNNGSTNSNPSDLKFWQLVFEDFQTHQYDWVSQGFWALFWHRFGNWRMSIRIRMLRIPFSILYHIMFKLNEWVGGICLPYTVIVGRRVKLEHFGGMVLVAESIGDDVVVRQNTTFGISRPDKKAARPIIGNGVDIGAGAALIGRVRVGDGAVIGANAVVTRDVCAGTVVGGVPAKRLGKRIDEFERA